MTWTRRDEAVANFWPRTSRTATPPTSRPGIIKPLPTGGVAGITFRTDYQLHQPAGRRVVNPAYRPRLQFQFEQPLLQGFGVEINQLRAAHPGSQSLDRRFQLSRRPRSKASCITRLRFDQQRAEFERNVNYMLLNVEVAYWNLYGSYWTLYSREQALRQAFEAWKINKARYEAGRIADPGPRPDPRPVRAVPRPAHRRPWARCWRHERQLRGLLGLPVEDGTRLVPSDRRRWPRTSPTGAPPSTRRWPCGRSWCWPARTSSPPARPDQPEEPAAARPALHVDLRHQRHRHPAGRRPADPRQRPSAASADERLQQLDPRPAAGRAARLPRRPRRSAAWPG